MIEVTVAICFVMLGCAALLALWRILRGPSILDRVIAYDAAAICIVGMMVMLSVLWKRGLLIEIIIIFSLLGFMGSIAFVNYLYTNIPRQRAASAAWRERKATMKREREAAAQNLANRTQQAKATLTASTTENIPELPFTRDLSSKKSSSTEQTGREPETTP